MHKLKTHLLAGAAAILTLPAAASGQDSAANGAAVANPALWPAIEPLPLDPAVEARVDEILSKLTIEQKVGQVIQADSNSVTPEEVKRYRLGSVLSGGNSAPGDKPYADTQAWLQAADAYYDASLDTEGVEVAVPLIWGIDAVHGHANLSGATVFPHNIGLGAARNPDLIKEIARVTARELSVSGHDWTFAPTVAVPRDDRWGRAYEGFSEDPDIVAAYAGPVVEGLQGTYGSEDFLGEARVISSAKHFLGDGGTSEGRDQGDAVISEEELRDIHNAGYTTAIPAGVRTVMVSFSGWNGKKMHGNESLLTGVLKERMGFHGFVVGDWNGHGQIKGCSNTDCPQSLIAGLDMYMAPDSWRGLYESTLRHVREGTIPMERLDDAVRRILRVKVEAGLFEKARPSERPLAGQVELVGSKAHRAVARQAVRESLVLLKNEGGVLPLESDSEVLVIGDGADSISKMAGGWTLSWQGGGYPNEEFPNGQSIFAAISEIVADGGGMAVLDPSGTSGKDADVVIAVYGEDPYAEFQGDTDHVDFVPNGFDPSVLKGYKDKGIPVVSVFLSGRPLFVNPELNASDAFVAAWLPGTEGGGVADLLFRTDPSYDFTGRLPFSWPKTATQTELNEGDEDYDPLFALGYGLAYADDGRLAALSEESGLGSSTAKTKGVYFRAGQPVAPWRLAVNRGRSTEMLEDRPSSVFGLEVGGVDYKAQEDALALSWKRRGAAFRLVAEEGVSLSRERTGQLDLVFAAKSLKAEPSTFAVGIDCALDGACRETVSVTAQADDWHDYRVSLSCFTSIDMEDVVVIASVKAPKGTRLGLGNVRLEPDTDGGENCGEHRGRSG
ncbi:MAG: glycoside hydrolase family 3 N-terminal domain-containing protein [Parvularcula sp.]|jgi:beta-glucosidase|nr:glycoside hydrolase family 3 N-terminal domain-containing protein [Parvularcula sp.]